MTALLNAFISELKIQLATPWRNVSLLSSIITIFVANSVRFIRLLKLKRIKMKPRQIPSSASM